MTRFKALVAALLFLATHVRADTRPPTEYEVKAAFIYNFTRYVQWPIATESRRPFVIGIIGSDPFGYVLDDTVRDQSVQGRHFTVKRFQRVEDTVNCDILFIPSSESGRLRQILETLRAAPVLTIGEVDRFAENGGMINLTTVDDRIRFEMNVQAINRAGLKAGSQLLRLAKLVNESRVAER